MQPVTCSVSSIEKLNTFVYRIFLKLPEADLFLAGGQHSIVVIIKSHLSITIGTKFHHESRRGKVIFVNLLTDGNINYVVKRYF